jgi:hypothetical protein
MLTEKKKKLRSYRVPRIAKKHKLAKNLRRETIAQLRLYKQWIHYKLRCLSPSSKYSLPKLKTSSRKFQLETMNRRLKKRRTLIRLAVTSCPLKAKIMPF